MSLITININVNGYKLEMKRYEFVMGAQLKNGRRESRMTMDTCKSPSHRFILGLSSFNYSCDISSFDYKALLYRTCQR